MNHPLAPHSLPFGVWRAWALWLSTRTFGAKLWWLLAGFPPQSACQKGIKQEKSDNHWQPPTWGTVAKTVNFAVSTFFPCPSLRLSSAPLWRVPSSAVKARWIGRWCPQQGPDGEAVNATCGLIMPYWAGGLGKKNMWTFLALLESGPKTEGFILEVWSWILILVMMMMRRRTRRRIGWFDEDEEADEDEDDYGG